MCTRLRLRSIFANGVWAIALAAAGAAAGDETGEIGIAVRALTAWSESLKAFDGSFALEQSGETLEAPISMEVAFRSDGVNAFCEIATLRPDRPDHDMETHALYAQRMDSLTRKSGRLYGVRGSKERDALPWPWGVYLLPEELFGRRYEHRLAEVLASGTTRIVRRDGRRVLWHVNPDIGRSVDIALDDENRPIRIDWVRRPSDYPDEALASMFGGDPFDIRILAISIELQDYQNIDGVDFPASAVKTWWRLDEDEVEALTARREAGALSDADFTVQLYSLSAGGMSRQTFRLISASINQPLDEADFRIDWPPGLDVRDASVPRPRPEAGVEVAGSGVRWIAAALGAASLLAIAAIVVGRQRTRQAE